MQTCSRLLGDAVKRARGELNLTQRQVAERIDAEVAKYNQMVLNHSISPLENPAQIKNLRRTIARMKAELRQRELNK